MDNKAVYKYKMLQFLGFISDVYPEIVEEYFNPEVHEVIVKDLDGNSFIKAGQLYYKIVT